MTLEALNQNTVTDEQVEERITALSQKQDINEDERKELEELKGERKTRYQKRIDKFTYQIKSAEEENERLKRELEEARAAKEDKPPARPSIRKETVEHDGETFYTDQALTALIEEKQMTEAEAIRHQQERIEAKAAERALKKIEQRNKAESAKELHMKTVKWVEEKYPHFNEKHPSFDPTDPVYVLADTLLKEGYGTHPEGIRLAIQRAESILKTQAGRPDLSKDLSVSSPSAPESTEKKEVDLSREEEETAVRLWTRRINPATGRNYTEKEAIVRAKAAKQRRVRR